MQFICDKNILCNAISHVSKAVSQKSTNAVLEGICVQMKENAVVLTGYNLEIGIQTEIEAECHDNFTCVFNARLFSDMAKRMSGDKIRCEMDDMLHVTLSCDNTQYQLSALPANDFPALPVVESTAKIPISQQILKSMIQESSFAASVKEDQPVLTGELFESQQDNLYIVAMDRYRLALRQEPMQGMAAFQFVVPKKALNELIGMLKDDAETPCEFSANSKHIVFFVNGFILFARLLEGRFHNFRSSIPADCKTTVILSKKELTACAERCSLLLNEKNKAPMRCVFENGCMEITCKTAIGAIRDKIPAAISGENLIIGMSNKYLLEALRVCQCDKIRLQMSGSNKVIKMIPLEGESFVYLIMPIQLKN